MAYLLAASAVLAAVARVSASVAVGRNELVVGGDRDPTDSVGDEVPAQEVAAKREALRRASFDDAHARKHLPGTPEANRLIAQEGAAHCFLDRQTMDSVTEEIIAHGEYLGIVRGHERWGRRFAEPIGVRQAQDGTTVPLHYGELKLNPRTGRYHVIPRTRPSGS